MKENFFERLIMEGRKLAVVSPATKDEAVMAAERLVQKKIYIMEIAYRNPDCPQLIDDCIRAVRRMVPQMFVAAATVTNVKTAKRALACGAQAIVTPGFNLKTVRYCLRHKIPVFPGVATPGEIEAAMNMGLYLLKLFPCEVLGGQSYLKALFGPYPKVRFIVSGGINADNEAEYLSLKNVACVSGSYLSRQEK